MSKMNIIKKIKVKVLVAFLLAMQAIPALAVDDENAVGEEINISRTALAKWVETQRIISQEKRDFDLAREMLTERIKLLEREIEELESKVITAKNNISAADSKRLDIVKENQQYNNNFTALGNLIGRLETGMRTMVKSLPSNVKSDVQPLSQRLPDENTGETKLSLSERFLNVIGILNQVDKFNRAITLASELRTLEDGSSVEVTSVYIGVGQAYFVNATGDVAGVGIVTNEGWQWNENNEIAGAVSEVIAILNNEKVASYVQMPVEIK